MSEKLEEAFNSIKDRFKNSFIITFLAVWTIIHWNLVYTVFNFDNDDYRPIKVHFIDNYIETHSMIWEPLWKSIVSLLVLYVIFIFSEVIHTGYNILRNIILKWFGDKKKIIEIEEYNRIGKELDEVRSRAGEYQRQESDYILSKKRLEEDLSSMTGKYTLSQQQIEINNKKIAELEPLEAENKLQRDSIKGLEEQNMELRKDALQFAEDLIKYRALKDEINQVKIDLELLNAFKLFVELSEKDLGEKWMDMTTSEKQNFIDEYYNIQEFKNIFGKDVWLKSDYVGSDYIYENNYRLVNEPLPAFLTEKGSKLLVNKIVFYGTTKLTFQTVDSTASNIVSNIELDISSPNQFKGSESGHNIIFNRKVNIPS